MASGSNDSFHERMKDTRHAEWCLAVYGLRSVKVGLEDVSDELMKEIYDKLVTEHGKKTCSSGESGCSHKNIKQNKKQYSIDCPDNVCDKWLKSVVAEVIKANHSPAQSWSNCEIQKWPVEYWQIATVFMMKGSASCCSARETDISGLLNVFINSKIFFNKGFKQNLAGNVRNDRNKILHSPNFQMEAEKRKEFISRMIFLLENVLDKRPSDQKVKKEIENLLKLRDAQSFKCLSDEIKDQMRKEEMSIWKEMKRELELLRCEIQDGKAGSDANREELDSQKKQLTNLVEGFKSFICQYTDLKEYFSNRLDEVEADIQRLKEQKGQSSSVSMASVTNNISGLISGCNIGDNNLIVVNNCNSNNTVDVRPKEFLSPTGGINFKNKLQEYCQQKKIAIPKYELIPDPANNDKKSAVIVNGERFESVGAYPKKKESEMDAACVALKALQTAEAQKAPKYAAEQPVAITAAAKNCKPEKEKESTEENMIGQLNEVCQRNSVPAPEYNERGDKSGEFSCDVKFKMVVVLNENFENKKCAEKAVAKAALTKLGIEKESNESKNELQAYAQRNGEGNLPVYECGEGWVKVTVDVKIATDDKYASKKEAKKAIAAKAMGGIRK